MGRPKKAIPQYIEPEEISQEDDSEEEAVTEFNRDHEEPAPAGGTIKKAEAVRRAIAAGHDSPEDGVAYLRQHFGIEMTKQVFSSNKAQQKAREKKQAEADTPAPESRRLRPLPQHRGRPHRLPWRPHPRRHRPASSETSPTSGGFWPPTARTGWKS